MDELFFDHGIEKTATYRQNPLRPVIEEGKTVEYRLDGNDTDFPYPILGELREKGFTHYVIAPLKYAIGITNGFSWATKRPGGFSPAEMRFFHDILAPYAAVAELKAMTRFIGSIMETYVGTEAGKLILEGQVQRGDTRAITAALMLVDLRDFTAMSDRLSPRAVIRMLNQYFDCVMSPVYENGGEVVEIMGDGVLAIFQHGPDNTAADVCEAALAAATEGLAALGDHNLRHPATPLRAGVALHYGAVSYGNIGAGNRLDFTVIGPDVNMTSRIERLCRELDRQLITARPSPKPSPAQCGRSAISNCAVSPGCSVCSNCRRRDGLRGLCPSYDAELVERAEHGEAHQHHRLSRKNSRSSATALRSPIPP